MESIRDLLRKLFEEVKTENANMSLDEILYEVYERANLGENENFDKVRSLILNANDINEYEYYTKEVNPELKRYIEENVFPEYEKNDEGHGIEHIWSVVRRSLKFAKQVSDINEEMVYVIASYHDIGVSIDRKHHEKVSADILRRDDKLKEFFDEEKIEIMAGAVEDHCASVEGEPRSIYGKIVSSAEWKYRC